MEITSDRVEMSPFWDTLCFADRQSGVEVANFSLTPTAVLLYSCDVSREI